MRLLRRLSPRGLCCPCTPLLRLTRLLGYSYTGYEVGHIQARPRLFSISPVSYDTQLGVASQRGPNAVHVWRSPLVLQGVM